jgi:subtilisin family serine protease
MAAYDACGGCSQPAEAFTSARDEDGHGTHTASTAAGNRAVKAEIYDIKRGTVSGIAPRAHVMSRLASTACWALPIPVAS